MAKTQNLHVFPAKAIVSAKTYYPGDVIVATMASNHAYRKPVNPASRGRCLPEETDLATLLARHREHLQRLAPPGQEPLAVDPEDLFELETAEHLKSQELHRARGCYYTWSDAFHQGFEIPRRELVN